MGIKDEFIERMDSTDEKWWRDKFREVLKGYRGATHGINRCLAEYEDQFKAIQELRKQVSELGQEQQKMAERLDRIAKFLDEFRKNGNS